jgi:arachidonate 15-lipoxygenase
MTVLLPSLPQNDWFSGSRNRALASEKNTYQINYDILPTLAMNDSLPITQIPKAPWIALVIKTLFNQERNARQVRDNTDLNTPNVDLEAALADIYANLAVVSILDTIKAMFALLETARPVGRPRDFADYELVFQSLVIPEYHNLYDDDDHFAELRVTGINPMVIRKVASLESHFPVTDAIFQATADFANDTLAAAGSEGRLFLADYEMLSTMEPGALENQPKYVYAPLALFALPKNGDKLKPVAIQCQQDHTANPIFTPNDGWSWKIAKAAVQVADTNHHELYSHLGTTHLVQEAIALANYRQLSYRHPLYILLEPHFEGTFFINFLATEILLPPGTPVPVLLSGTSDSLYAQAVQARTNHSFRDSFPPVSLVDRGVMDLPYFPYRDDALSLWTAINDWVSEYLNLYYSSDSDVQNDSEVQAWSEEIGSQTGGRLQGFGDVNGTGISTLQLLIDTATMAIFNGSVQHAAVNFPQRTQMGFAPMYPMAGYVPAPTDTNSTQSDFLDFFPPMDNAMQGAETLDLLGSINHTQLGQYNFGHFGHLSVVIPLAKFKSALSTLENNIETRNISFDKPYTTLLPSLIPQSTNI